MTTRDEEYQLGRDVTHLAKANDKRGTAVISVRLGATDIARLEGIGRESGKTVSQGRPGGNCRLPRKTPGVGSRVLEWFHGHLG